MSDVFISYSSEDKSTADAVCSALEKNDISCWIAPRDIVAGNYAAAIVKAINSSKVVVLVFSSNANHSSQVRREIERAASRGKIIYPFRIENVLPSEDLELFISSEHWMDAFLPPLQTHLDKFSDNLKQLLSGKPAEISRLAARSDKRPNETRESPKPAKRPLLARLGWDQIRVGILFAVALIVLIALIWNASSNRDRPGPEAIAQPSATPTSENKGDSQNDGGNTRFVAGPRDNTRCPHRGVVNGLITIRRAKELLKEFGHYNGQMNDVDDEEFRRAVRSYQDANGLVPDGCLGPATAARLRGS